ncbi:MAG: cytochrome C oxidase subunit IV family protein [Dehalococcoidia bacterium]
MSMQDETLNVDQEGTAVPSPAAQEAAHPSVTTYIKVAIILAIITIVEVGVFFLDFNRTAFILVFIVMSGVKFAIVIMFYMHLKFDNILFSRLFIGGLALAAALMLSILALFRVLAD